MGSNEDVREQSLPFIPPEPWLQASRSRPQRPQELVTMAHLSAALDGFRQDGNRSYTRVKTNLDLLSRMQRECRDVQDRLDTNIEDIADRILSVLDGLVKGTNTAQTPLTDPVAQVQRMVSIAQNADLALMKAIHLRALRQNVGDQLKHNLLTHELDAIRFELSSSRLEEGGCTGTDSSPEEPTGDEVQIQGNERKILKLLSNLSHLISNVAQANRQPTGYISADGSKVEVDDVSQSWPPQFDASTPTLPKVIEANLKVPHNSSSMTLEHSESDFETDEDSKHHCLQSLAYEMGLQAFADGPFEECSENPGTPSVNSGGECCKPQELSGEGTWSQLPFCDVNIELEYIPAPAYANATLIQWQGQFGEIRSPAWRAISESCWEHLKIARKLMRALNDAASRLFRRSVRVWVEFEQKIEGPCSRGWQAYRTEFATKSVWPTSWAATVLNEGWVADRLRFRVALAGIIPTLLEPPPSTKPNKTVDSQLLILLSHTSEYVTSSLGSGLYSSSEKDGVRPMGISSQSGLLLHEADLTQTNPVALRSWEPQESLIDCAYALNEFLENSSFKFVENDGSEYFEGKAQWLKEKAKAAKDRDAGKPPNPEPTLFGAGIDPEASTLWKTPKDFGMDADDRTLSYETVVDCLEAVGVDGRALYHRVKTDMKDPDDKGWMSNDCCSICQDKQFDINEGCLLACTDKKKYYCDVCVSKCRAQWADDQGRVQCPFCRQQTFFISTTWIFVNDKAKREEARKASRKKYQREKKSRKRRQLAEARKASVQHA
ncbi:hypothetical protein PQX77_019040 [Marasmius sp. AFHP31]|nr:hypothetical protein PQX77_019040 [Marasmius sp. AFHP31]